jgi:hypothetical protein
VPSSAGIGSLWRWRYNPSTNCFASSGRYNAKLKCFTLKKKALRTLETAKRKYLREFEFSRILCENFPVLLGLRPCKTWLFVEDSVSSSEEAASVGNKYQCILCIQTLLENVVTLFSWFRLVHEDYEQNVLGLRISWR